MNPERFEEKIAEYTELVEVDLSFYDDLGISSIDGADTIVEIG
jgi:hypothetical protein